MSSLISWYTARSVFVLFALFSVIGFFPTKSLSRSSTQCWLSVGKIFDLSEPVDDAEGSIFTRNTSAFEEILFLDGKAVGRVQGEIVFETVPIVEQLAGGVLTELGVQASR